MSGLLLSPEQRQMLQEIADKAEKERVRKRAQVLLDYSAGLTSKQIAADLGVSERSARYWRRLFQQRGMEIFQESHAEGALLEKNKAKPSPASSKKIKTPPLDIKDGMQLAGKKVFRFCLKQMLAHEAGTRQGDDIEELHDMRVAARRLRAALRLFDPYFPKKVMKRIQKEARACGQALGRVRDLDVFMEKAKQDFSQLDHSSSQDLLPFMVLWEEEHTKVRQALLDYLDSGAYQQFVEKFSTFLEEPTMTENEGDLGRKPQPSRVGECVPIILYQRFAEVCAFDPTIEKASFEQLHELRRALKMFRYTLEFFSDVLSKEEAQSVIQECKKIQDYLGDLNDAHNACLLITKYKTIHEERQGNRLLYERQNPPIFLTYLIIKEEQRYKLLSNFAEVWHAFYSPMTKQYLARAIAAI